jgi:NADPH:quinone reductase-like Zn-dependent oxidoreductase
MKAVVQSTFGGVETLQVEEVPTPVVQAPYDVLVEVAVANVSSGDRRLNQQQVDGLAKVLVRWLYGSETPKHKVRGIAGAGKVLAVGEKVTDVKVGQRINFIQSASLGVMAEKVLLTKGSVYAPIADSLSYEEAAPLAFGAMSAMSVMNPQYIKKGMKVFIYGASGSVGTYAVSLAKACGAHVTASARSVHQAKLGALNVDRWVDHSKGEHLDLPRHFDVVYDASGFFSEIKAVPLLGLGGRYFTINALTKESKARLHELNAMAKAGKLPTILDGVYPMNEFKQAHKHVYEGHKTGNVVLLTKAAGTKAVEKQAAPAEKSPVAKATPAAKKIKIKQVPQSQSEWLKTCNVVPGVVTAPGMVETLGAVIPTENERFAKGQAVRVAIHPTDLYVSQKGLIQGVVVSQGFRGVNYTLKVKIKDRMIDVLSQDLVEEGQEIRLSVLPKDVHLLQASK